MKKRGLDFTLFDGLPLLSDPTLGGLGLFLLRVSYLCFCCLPAIVSTLDAIKGATATFFFLLSVLTLAAPLVLDTVMRFLHRDAFLDSLLVLSACAFMIWDRRHVFAVVILLVYHVLDLSVCLLLRGARRRVLGQLRPVSAGGSATTCEMGQTIHVQEGELLPADCRVISGEAICSLRTFDRFFGEFEAREGDVLFSGTQLVEGELTATVLSDSETGLARSVSRKVRRCTDSVSRGETALKKISIVLQPVYLLVLLMCVTFFYENSLKVLLSFSGFYFCFSVAYRFLRSVELFLLDYFARRGAYPESIRLFSRLKGPFSTISYLDWRKVKTAPISKDARRYRVRARLLRKVPVVLEYASEHSALIARADLVLLYRSREILAVLTEKLAYTRVIFSLCALLFFVLSAVCFLLLSLTGSLSLSASVLATSVVALCGTMAFSFYVKKEKED